MTNDTPTTIHPTKGDRGVTRCYDEVVDAHSYVVVEFNGDEWRTVAERPLPRDHDPYMVREFEWHDQTRLSLEYPEHPRGYGVVYTDLSLTTIYIPSLQPADARGV